MSQRTIPVPKNPRPSVATHPALDVHDDPESGARARRRATAGASSLEQTPVPEGDGEGRGGRQTLTRVQRALRSAQFGQPIRSITLEVDGNALLARGVLPDVASKKLATQAIASVVGREDLEDRLRVARRFPMQDPDLCERVGRALAADSLFANTRVIAELPNGRTLLAESVPARGEIVVSVSDGVAELAGDVPSRAHARLAVVLAWWSGGAADVVDRLHVSSPDVDGDVELMDAIRMVLIRDPLLDGSRFRVDVRHTRATLSGTAKTDDERTLAERDAWYVPGIEAVDNQIEVASAAR